MAKAESKNKTVKTKAETKKTKKVSTKKTATKIVKKPKKKPIELEVYTYLIVSDHCVLLSSDDSDGLMKGLKRLPQFDAPLLIDAKPMMEMKHVFSHRIWKMKIYHSDKKAELENCFWCPVDQLDEVTMVTAHRKILQRVFGLK